MTAKLSQHPHVCHNSSMIPPSTSSTPPLNTSAQTTPAPNAAELPQLPAMSLQDLLALMKSWNMPAFRAKQILQWRNKGVLEPQQMRNLPAELKQKLASEVLCQPLKLIHKQVSTDGTRKYVFALTRSRVSGKMIESVCIPEEQRGTVCISSQVGCVLDCPFCHTGTQAFETNLTAGEIIAQILAIKADLSENPMPENLHNELTHVVYMGMGEPLANEANLHQSLAMLLSEEGLHISRRRSTVSTSGLVPQIQRLGEVFPVNLAISLHAATDELRNELVPINRKYPLAALRACLDEYPLTSQRHITLEYVMLGGVNDDEKLAAALIKFANPLRERVNLIQFNTYPGSPYQGSSKENMNKFSQRLISKGIRATLRRSRGEDIMAACGQLKADQTLKA